MQTDDGKKPIVRVRQARLDDHGQVMALAGQYGLTTRSFDEWQHLWQENPALDRWPHKWPMGWVLEDEGARIVGFIGNIPLEYTFEGRTLVAAALTSTVIDKVYRRIADDNFPKAALKLLEAFYHQPHADLVMSSTASAAQEKNHAYFGARRVPAVSYDEASLRITQYRGFARSVAETKAIPLKWAAAPVLALGLRATDELLRRNPGPRSFRGTIRTVPFFDGRFDEFWADLKARYPSILMRVRDRRHLGWHFKYPLSSCRIWILVAEQASRMVGYAIFLRNDVARVGLKRMSLVDLQTIDASAETMGALLSAGVTMCREARLHVVEAIGFNQAKRAVIERLCPHSRKLPSWRFYYYTADDGLAGRLRRPEIWDPCTLDGDSTL